MLQIPALNLRHIAQFTAAALLAVNINLTAHASFIDDYMIDPDDGMFDTSQYLSEVPMGFLPVPVIITEPAVGNGLGVVGVFFHESDEQKKKANKVSKRGRAVIPENISIAAFAGTENGSKAAALGHIGFWFEDNLRYQGFVLLPDINMDFYSIGGIDLPRPFELNITGPVVVQNMKARINNSEWFVGFRQIYSEITSSVSGSNPIGGGGYNLESKTVTSGLGLILEYDSRNNPMNPEKGYNYQLRTTRFDKAIGSDINYDLHYFKGLNYWELSKSFNFALRLQFDEVSAEKGQPLPPYVAPSIELRGIPAMRYQGNQVSVGEIELTWKLNQRWRFNTFTGTGRAGKDFDELSSAENINNYGVGFRYLIAKRYGFTMGTDVAKGPEETVFYIQAGSSW